MAVKSANFRQFPKKDFHRIKRKYPQNFLLKAQKKIVDIVDGVDNLNSKQGFSDFMHISGPHSYQQISVDTIF